MRTVLLTIVTVALTASLPAQDNKKAFLDPIEAGRDFDIQGEYAGTVGEGDNAVRVGIQVIADGDGKFRSVGFVGGLPGDGWDGSPEKRIPGSGQMEGDVCILKADNPDSDGRAEIKEGNLTLYTGDNVRIAEFNKVRRQSPTLGKTPPEGAVVLFDGSNADQFKDGRMSEDKLLMEGCTSHRKFQSYQLHMEFMLSFMPYARGQGRSNSGVYNQGRYEVQILDSFGLEGKHNECGGIYTIEDPYVNMCFPPLSWQTYDIEYHAATFDDAGKKTADAWMTVRHNGVVVHEKTKLDHSTTASPLKEGPEPGPIFLQNHGNPVRFRNIWVLPIDG
ncbi:MAG: DUF1080 domain-containing protein [Fuerstiella sp.]